MRLRLSIGLLLAGLVLLASPVASGQESASDQKRMVDGRISSLQEKIQAAREREGVLSSEIEVVSEKIDALQNDVDAASARLNELETVLALHQRKLDRLNALYELQTRKLVFLQHQHKEAVARLSKRLVEIYTSERTSSISVVLDSGSFSDMLDQLEFLNTIGRQDHKIANEVETAKLQMQETRNSTRKTRRQVAETTAAVAARTAEQRAVRDRLAWSQRELATARRDKRTTLASVREDKEDAIGHMRDLQAQSAALGAKIRSAQSSYVVPAPTGAASAAGFVWPVQGVITSGFGWRWGRMHEGIDLAVPDRHARRGCESRDRDRRGLDGWLRQPRRRRPRRRRRDGLWPQHERHGRRRPVRRPGAADRLLRQHRPLDRPARPLRGADQRQRRRPASGYL